MVITMVFCQNCGQQNDESSNFCIYCGTKLMIDSLKCSKCGELNESSSNFCVNCGNALKNQLIKQENTLKSSQHEVENQSESTENQIQTVPPYQREPAYQIHMTVSPKGINTSEKGIIPFVKMGTRKKRTPRPQKTQEELEAEWEAHATDEQKLMRKIAENNKNGRELVEQGKYDEAMILYKENIDLNADTPHCYYGLAGIYHHQKEFELERDVLKLGIERIDKLPNVNDNIKQGMKNSLENVEFYLKTGKFKYDCLPVDSKTTYFKIRDAKETLKEDRAFGIEQLEDIIVEGTYNNTAYYKLYKEYLKDERYDDAIKLCDLTIDILGLFSQDRIEKWSKYKDKAIAKKEKES